MRVIASPDLSGRGNLIPCRLHRDCFVAMLLATTKRKGSCHWQKCVTNHINEQMTLFVTRLIAIMGKTIGASCDFEALPLWSCVQQECLWIICRCCV